MSSSVAVISGCLNLNKFKGTTTASACNFYLLKTVKKSEHNGHVSVLQTKQITQIQKQKKNGRPFLEK